MRPRRLEDVQGADDVHVRVELRPLDRHADVSLRRQVEADVGAHLVEDSPGVGADITLVDVHALRDVVALPPGEVVEHVHLVPARD